MCGLKPSGAHCSLENSSCVVFKLCWTEPGIYSPHADVSQTWDIHTFLMHSKRNVYTTSLSSQLLIGFLCKTKATFVSPLCWGEAKFFAADVLSHCGHTELCSMSLLPIPAETSSVIGVYWISHIIPEPRKLVTSALKSVVCVVNLTDGEPCLGRGGKENQYHACLSRLEIILFLKHICITLKISSVGNSGKPFWTPETFKFFALQASTQTVL